VLVLVLGLVGGRRPEHEHENENEDEGKKRRGFSHLFAVLGPFSGTQRVAAIDYDSNCDPLLASLISPVS
jgi:hypothetical protein